MAMAMAGDYALVVGTQGGWIFDVSRRGRIKFAGHFPAHDAVDIAASGHIACIADSTGGYFNPAYGFLRILNFANPALPVMQGFYDYSFALTRAKDLSMSGDRLYATSGRGFDVFDLSNPANPLQIGRGVNDPYQPSGAVTVSGDFAFVTSVYGLHVFDLSNPTKPTQIGLSGSGAGGSAVRVFDNVAYVYNGRIHLIGVTNPASPVFLKSLPDECGTASSLSGSVAWFGNKLLDVSVSTAPNVLGCLDAVDAEVAGDIAYVAIPQGLQIFDISNPGAPMLLDWFNTATLPTIPPMITVQPQAVSVTSGATVIFNVAAVGDAPLGYQWRFNGTSLPGATNSDFSIPAVQTNHAGLYSVGGRS
jgi:hypothetical protein